jgi:disulfide bond formation protein DsbB
MGVNNYENPINRGISMTDEKQASETNNLYIPSVMGILLILIAAAVVWVGQVRPSEAEPVAVESASTTAPTAAPAQTSQGDPAAGQTVYTGTCSACHGPTGEGIQGLGKDLITSEFVAGQSDDELLAFIKGGRGPTDPLNTTGIDMPPKGGNPALNDEDLQNVIAFLRSIHK